MGGPGGKREGAGRPVGSTNRKTKEIQAAIEASGLTPLDFLISTIRNDALPYDTRLDAAKSAAPFVHARLATINVNDVTPRKSLAELDARILELLSAVAEARAVRSIAAAPVIDGELDEEE